ncbi:acyltransferase family protein [Paraburkholderia silviterrae]|uniref:acyltransferase family protein n=1 Tax=Paraburkholderia silviterrae TaxID=2528715 RepID=UPI003626EA84
MDSLANRAANGGAIGTRIIPAALPTATDMNIHPLSKPAGRTESLDVIRGIAAMVVMLSHCSIGVSTAMPAAWAALAWTPLRFFWSGHQSVIMFFVLSGFALTRMIESMKPYGYWKYLGARVARLYPPYILSVVFALAVFGTISAFGVHWEWGWMTVSKPYLTLPLALGHLMMVGVFQMGDINPVIWSLVYEMRISILFPLVLWAVSRYNFKAVFAFVGLSLLYWLRYRGLTWDWPLTATSNLLETLHYTTFFAFGSWIALNQISIRAKLAALSKVATGMMWLLGLALFTYSYNGSFHLGQRALADVFIGIGSVIVIALSLDLAHGALFNIGKWFGKISYSLYLTHTPILHACLILLFPRIGGIATALIAIVLAIGFAALFNRYIEQPSIRLARAVARRNRAAHPANYPA